jgi:predicted nucleotidyltransferase
MMGPLIVRVHELRESLSDIAAAYGGRNLRVFGSVARGEERPDSDVDVILTLEEGRTLLDIARLEIALESVVGRRVDLITDDGLEEPFRSGILREAVPV